MHSQVWVEGIIQDSFARTPRILSQDLRSHHALNIPDLTEKYQEYNAPATPVSQ